MHKSACRSSRTIPRAYTGQYKIQLMWLIGGVAKSGIIVRLQYFTPPGQSQKQQVELFHIVNPVRRLFLGLCRLNYLFCFAKLPKFPLIYLTQLPL